MTTELSPWALLDSLPDAIICLSEESRIQYLNAAGERLLGYDLATARGKTASEVPTLSAFLHLLNGSSALPAVPTGTSEWRCLPVSRAGGISALYEAALSSLSLGQKQFQMLVLRPLSHPRQAEEVWQAWFARRAERVLLDRFAHDLSNSLAALAIKLESAAEPNSSLPEIKDHLEVAQTVAARLVDANRDLRTFLNAPKERNLLLDLTKLLHEFVPVLRERCTHSIQLRVDTVAIGQCLVRGNENELRQVLIHVGLNAVEATPKGGEILIQLTNVTRSADRTDPPGREGEFAELIVRDVGKGMAPEVLSRIFEPYFTTKGPANSTGLSFFIARQIVEMHHGWVQVESNIGSGTQVKIFLPRVGLG